MAVAEQASAVLGSRPRRERALTKLNHLRRRALLTGDELAQKSGVGKSTIYAVERGRHRPGLRVIRKLSAALGVDPRDVDEFREALGLPAQPDASERQQAAAA
jgi:transcriptional regulator with XRE-family HTH domain